MSDERCDHECLAHPRDDGTLWVRVENQETSELTRLVSQLGYYEDSQRRRMLNWLRDYFEELR